MRWIGPTHHHITGKGYDCRLDCRQCSGASNRCHSAGLDGKSSVAAVQPLQWSQDGVPNVGHTCDRDGDLSADSWLLQWRSLLTNSSLSLCRCAFVGPNLLSTGSRSVRLGERWSSISLNYWVKRRKSNRGHRRAVVHRSERRIRREVLTEFVSCVR